MIDFEKEAEKVWHSFDVCRTREDDWAAIAAFGRRCAAEAMEEAERIAIEMKSIQAVSPSENHYAWGFDCGRMSVANRLRAKADALLKESGEPQQ